MFHLKSIHQQVKVFNDVIINIFSNFVPNEIIEGDDRDPPWMNDFIKTKLNKKIKHSNYTKPIEWVVSSLL